MRKSIFNWAILLVLYFFTINAFAEGTAAKEETTPPAAEGPITPDRVPPIVSEGQMPSAATPASPATPAQQPVSSGAVPPTSMPSSAPPPPQTN